MKSYAIITEEIKNKIVELYNSGLTIKKVAEKLDICFVTAKKYLKLSGKKNRKFTRKGSKYLIDELFFEQINTHHKAQILGMIFADGCLMKNGKGDSWKLEIGLQIKDKKYIEQVNNITKNKLNIKITDYKQKDKPEYKIHVKNRQPVAHWRTFNYKLCTDIQKLGIHQRKSFTCQFPTSNQVPNEFLNSFILGCYEGDGTFSINWKKFESYFSLIGNDSFVLALKNKVFEIHGIHMSFVPHKLSKGISVVSITGNHQVIKFMDWLYKDSNEQLRLERKYNNYIIFKKKFLEKQEYLKSDQFNNIKQEKTSKTRIKFNRNNTDNPFYIKDIQNNIYFSNKLNDFYKKYHLTPCHASMLLNQKRQEYNGWTIPTEQEIQVAKENNTIINEIFEPKRQERHKHLTNFYLKDYNGKIYFSETVDRVIKHYPQIERRFIVWTINHKVKRKNQSNFLYPTNQEIETAKQNNSIIILE